MSAIEDPASIALSPQRMAELRHEVATGGRVDVARVRLELLSRGGAVDALSVRPRRGWRDDVTPWWCTRCRTVWYGLLPPAAAGRCPQPRPGGRCGHRLDDARALTDVRLKELENAAMRIVDELTRTAS